MRRVLTMMAAVAVAMLSASPAAGGAHAQTPGGWRQQLVVPSGDLYAAVFVTPDVAWAVGPGGIFRSSDGGRSWSVAYIGGDSPGWLLAVAAAPDGLHGWAVGGLGLIVSTTDGGKTWTRQASGTQVNLDTVAAVGNARGVDIGFSDVVSVGPKPHVILRTSDSGATWQEVRIAPDYEISTVTFLPDGRHGWMAGARWLCAPDPNAGPGCTREQALFRSEDGGASWGVVNTYVDLRRIAFVDATTGWATGYRCDGGVRCVPVVVRTADGGATWTEVRALSESGYLGDIVGFDAKVAAVVETSCDVPAAAPCTRSLMRTTDGGATWRATSSRGSDSGSVLAFAGTARGVWAGYAGPQWTDDGATWQAAQFPVTVGSGAFDFANARDGWFAASKLLRTRDGGATWAPVSDRALVGVAFVSADEGWGLEASCPASAGCGMFDVLHTTDGGTTWIRQFTTPMLLSTPELAFTSAAAGWLMSPDDDRVFHTRDGGATWYEQRPPAPRARIAFVGSLFAVATAPSCGGSSEGCTPRIYVSIDGGDTWVRRADVPAAQGCRAPGIAALDAGYIWVALSRCGTGADPTVIWRSGDAGRTWQSTQIDGQLSFGALRFFDQRTGRATGTRCGATGCSGLLLRTSDGGATWRAEPMPKGASMGAGVASARFVSPEHLWVMVQTGGGVFTVGQQRLYAYAGVEPALDAPPPITMPGTGGGPAGGEGSDVLAALIAACAFAGAAVSGTGVGLRRRRPRAARYAS